MPRLLLMEGNPRHRRERGAERGVRTGSAMYRAAISAHFPEIDFDIICAADDGATMPGGRAITDYDGFVVCGSTFGPLSGRGPQGSAARNPGLRYGILSGFG